MPTSPRPIIGSPTLVVRAEIHATEEHALSLIVTGKQRKKKPADCDDLTISCKPTLYSCEPVANCASYDIPAPGCSPMECDPVSTAPPSS